MDKPLQPEEMKAIEARCEAAAPGPWKREGDAVYTGYECGDTCERTLHDHFVFADPDVKPADAEFIAHARSDIPRLIATIEEAHREQPVTDAEVEVACVSRYESENPGKKWITATTYDKGNGHEWAEEYRSRVRGILCGRQQPVRVTDEMVEAACVRTGSDWEKYAKRYPDLASNRRKRYRIIIESALAAAPEEGEE